MEKTTKKMPQIYALETRYIDEFDKLRKLVEIFSYHWKMEGKVSNVLRSKLSVLLTLYLKDGFNKKTKEKACEVLGVDISSVNCMNLELRQGNYLKKDEMNTRVNHLHEDLELLKEYVKGLPIDGGTPLLLFKMNKPNV